MDDKEFNRLADTTLAQIEAALEASDAVLDFELQHGGVLEIEFANGSKIIVNKHGVAKEIWVAAKSGGFHFYFDGAAWRDTRSNESLESLLSRVVSEQSGCVMPITI